MNCRNKASAWSAPLQEVTREALATLSVLPTPAGRIAFKHVNGAFALMSEEDLITGRLALADRRSAIFTIFADADALVGAGWVLD